jgi:signal transduction histidine kinase
MSEKEETGHRTALVLDASAEHELRNHLSIILGFCDLLQRDTAASDAARADLHEIQQAAAGALAIVTEARTTLEPKC